MALQNRAKSIISKGMRDMTPFTTGNVTGRVFADWDDVPTGRMPSDAVAVARKLTADDAQIMVVFSYGTPIAYTNGGSWEVPIVKYSPTTTNHQSVVSVNAANPGFDAR